MKKKILGLFLFIISGSTFGQKNPVFFGEAIIVDSSKTLLIPTRYNADILSSSKVAVWNNFFANIIFYNIETDSAQKLFKDDTFIDGFGNTNNINSRFNDGTQLNNISSKWIFYFVKTTDYDNSGRIDNGDPSILYVSDKFGNNLQSITSTTEDAISIMIFEQQGFALIKMLRDSDFDKDFQINDKDFYYIRLDLNTLQLGKKLEIK